MEEPNTQKKPGRKPEKRSSQPVYAPDPKSQQELMKELTERNKELQLFFRLSEMAGSAEVTLNEIYQELTRIIPESWQYPDLACARIIMGDIDFRSDNFRETPWMLKVPVFVDGAESGILEVGYTKKPPSAGPDDKDPFIPEEKKLAGAVAAQIGQITGRIQLREALREREHKLETTLRSIGDGVISTDTRGRVTAMNPVAEELCGWTEAEAAGRPLGEVFRIVDARTRESVPDPALEVLEKEKVLALSNHTTLISRDGREYQIADTAAPIRNRLSVITGVVLVFSDVTEKYAIREELRKSQERLDLAMSVENVGLWDWDLRTNETFFDDRYFTMAGYRPKEFPQTFKGWADRVHPDDLEATSGLIRNFLGSESESYVAEFRFRTKQGDWMWIKGKGQIVERGDDGTPLRLIGTHTDITERKKFEEALRRNLEEKNILLSEIHHRVKNNMAVICSLLALQSDFAHGKINPETILQDLQTRIMSMAWVHELVYESNDFTRIPSGKLIDRVTGYLRNHYKPDDKEILVKIRSGDLFLDMNRSVPLTLFVNEVLTNAFKHAFCDRKQGTIEVTLEKREKGITFSVKDDGVGVPDLERLNRPDSFGYTIIHGLVSQLRGKLAFSTPPEGGLQVEAWFPGETIRDMAAAGPHSGEESENEA